ncbi:MAG: M12 family metallopeptidase [Capsulimonas sp.]|uniref:M12 family metallopeptidase n=1 Tax=Capsulimonas sp. TaxID=2494211 RepID=UPI0032647346
MRTHKRFSAAAITTAVLAQSVFMASSTGAFAQTSPDVTIDDMVVSADMYAAMQPPVPGTPPPPSGFAPVKKWWQGYVPYQFDSDVLPINRERFRAACVQWQAYTDVHFIPRTDQTSYLQIHNSSVNNSFLGFNGGKQDLNLFNWDYRYIICHELGHALGLVHEHNRADRDNYVTINFANMDASHTHDFVKLNNTLDRGPYDFDSVMHYYLTAYSNNTLPTITIKTPYSSYWNYDNVGHTTHLSVLDKAGVASIYGQRARFDLNFDRKDDLIWQDASTGLVNAWMMDTTAATAGGNVTIASGTDAPLPSQWRIAGTGDFNDDGQADILWQNQNDGGNMVVWYMHGATHYYNVPITQPFGVLPAAQKLVSVNDFNTDGRPDLLWQNTSTGEITCWLMHGTTTTTDDRITVFSAQTAPSPASWRIVASGDFNRDGQPDILWQNQQESSLLNVYYMNETNFLSDQSHQTISEPYGTYPLNWKVIGTGDFNADGQVDILWQDSTNSSNTKVWLMNGAVAQTNGNLTVTNPYGAISATASIVGMR